MSEYLGKGRKPADRAQAGTAQRQNAPVLRDNRAPNRTGLPDSLKSGIEAMSGMDLSEVRVHRNSAKPAQLNAHAYAQGNDIHLGPGQARHLPHEAWHVVQQRQGRVKPTMQMAGVEVNDEAGLEHEADVMGGMAALQEASMPPAPGAAQGHVAAGMLAQGQSASATAPAVHQLSIIGDLTAQTLGSFLSKRSLGALLGFADHQALEALSSYSSFKAVYDTAVSFSNALTLAINIWDSIPAPVRTGILFLTGKLMMAIPLVNKMSYTEELIVDADQDVKDTYLVYAVDQLKMVLKAVNSPVSSAIGFGKYLYSSWWGGGGGDSPAAKAGEARAAKSGDRRGDLAKLNLEIIWLDVKALHLEKTKRGKNGEETQKGGLHADFAFGVNIFNESRNLGEVQQLTLILPWSGGVLLHCSGPVNIIKKFTFQDLFEINQLDMTMLEISNEGLQKLSFQLGKLDIGGDALSMGSAKAGYAKGKGMNFRGDMALNMYGWHAKAALELILDGDGKFDDGKVTDFSESSKMLTIGSASLNKDKGFSLVDAEVDLQPVTGLDLKAKLPALNITRSSVSGTATVQANDIPLLGDKIKLAKVGGKATYRSSTDWEVEASAALSMKFPHVQSSGQFSISHKSLSGATDLQLKNGKFQAGYAGVTLTASGMEYQHAKRSFTLSNAEIDVKAIDTRMAVSGVTIDHNGVAFDEASISHKKTITLFKGVTIDNTLLTLGKNADGFKASAEADLAVDIGSPKVQGEAKRVSVSFDSNGLRGTAGALKLRTTPFNLEMENARFSKHELSVGKANIAFNTGGSRESDREAGQMIPSLKQGLLDFIPIGPIAFEADNVLVAPTGFSVGGIKTLIPAVSFSAFGVDGHVDLEKLTATLSANHQLSLDKMTGLPLKAEVFFPVFPGLEIYGSLAGCANLGLGFNFSAGAEDNDWAVKGALKVNAGITLTAGLGAQLGSQLLVAMSAGLFAEGKAELVNAGATISGTTRYDRPRKKFVVVKPLQVDYDFSAAAIVSVGGEIKVKALYFFERTLYRYTAAEWTLGKYELKGKLGDADGKLAPEKADKLGLASNKAAPAPTSALDAQTTASKLRSDEPIGNSADARLELLKDDAGKTSQQLQQLHKSATAEREELKRLELRYVAVMRKKQQWAEAMVHSMSADAVNRKLEEFNVKHGVEALQQSYSARVAELEGIQHRIDMALQKLAALGSSGASGLDHGVKSKLDEVSALGDIAIPAGTSLHHGGAVLDKADKDIDDEVKRQKLVLDTLNRVMPLSSFISNTTTSNLLGQTVRKTIVPVDHALEAYHQDKGAPALLHLKKQIDIYLSHSDSQRTAYVLLLQSQVLAALKVAA
jgi:hypothetical protein